MTRDLLIKNGLVVDGTGREAARADVLVSGEKIEAIGNLAGASARIEIDASGKVVCPGFIDVHSHSDITPLANPTMESKVMQGVTTEVVGNCGFGAAPLLGEDVSELKAALAFTASDLVDWTWRSMAEYREVLQKAPPSINIAPLVGHIPLRTAVLGFEEVEPNSAELERICYLAEEALEQGGAGISVGLIYPVSCYAELPELVALAKVAQGRGGVFSMHIRNEAHLLLEAVEEAIVIGELSGCRVEISHHKAAGKKNWGQVAASVDMIERARLRGVDIAFDAYPYPAGSTVLSILIPARYHRGGQEKLLARLANSHSRQEIKEAMIQERALSMGSESEEEAFGSIVIGTVQSEENGRFQGKSLIEAGEMLGMSPADATLHLVSEERGRVNMITFHMDENDVTYVLSHPLCVIGSDGLAIASSGLTAKGFCHPRCFGAFPRFLARFVRDKKLMSLEEGIAKTTLRPATRFGILDRGWLHPGYFADTVIFDYNKLTDCATYESPYQFPQGIEYVFVNGTAVIENSQHTRVSPGRVL